MARVDREPISLLDDPTTFVDYLASLTPQEELPLAEKRRLLGQVRADYRRADELLKPLPFTMRFRPNGRLSGHYRSVDLLSGVHIGEPFLTDGYGRVEIALSYGEDYLMLSPKWKGRHDIRMAFHGTPRDREFRALFVKDSMIDINQADKPHLVQRGFVITARPFSLRPLGPNEMF